MTKRRAEPHHTSEPPYGSVRDSVQMMHISLPMVPTVQDETAGS